MKSPENFFAEVRARFVHPKLEILGECIANNLPVVTVRNHSFDVTFEVVPGIDWPMRYHAETRAISAQR